MMTEALKGLDFLGEEQVRIPVGGVMTPDLIGYWSGGIAYSVLAELDKSVVESEGITPSLVEGNGPWYRYFFKTFDECQKAIEKLQIEGFRGGLRRPDQEWRFESPADKLLNMSRDDNPFGDPAAFSVRLSTLRSKKYRHELHLISLPAAVAAAATRLGFANPGFPMHELLDQDTIFTDEFQAQMIGDPDGDYWASVLGQRRDALWNALGESDPKKYQPTGTGTRFDTESEKLSLCLQILATKWAKPVWGRLMLVPDPRVEAVYESKSGDTRRLSIPALVEIFVDEVAARTAAEAEGAESGGASTPSASGEKAVPEAYTDHLEMFHQAIERFKAKGVQGPPPVIAAAIGAEPDFQGCSPAEVMAWL